VSVARKKARLAGLVAHRDPEDPAIAEARRDLAVAKLEDDGAKLRDRIREIAATAPPLTPEQAAKLCALLPAPSAGDGDAG
jgi:hypothetical protein